MAKPMTADQTIAAMKKWRVPYREWTDWKTRGRDPEHGPFSNVHGIVIHHTGSDKGQSDDYLDFLATRGRPDLPGPLCNVSTDMDGDLWLIAQGRANHAGSGSSVVLAHAANEDYAGYTSELKPGPDNIDGNAAYYGNEMRYDGGQPPTAKMYAAATRWAAAVCDFHGWSALSIIGHREHTSRKNDPGNCPMNKFRADVAALLKAGPPGSVPGVTPAPPTAAAKDVTITGACIRRLANDHLGVSDACLVDNQQVMNIAVYFYPNMAETTRPYFWKMCAQGNWAEAGKMMHYAVRIIQAEAKLPQDGVFGPKTAAFLTTRGYKINP